MATTEQGGGGIMAARRLPDGRLRVPVRAEGPGGIVGDGMAEIGPDDPRYQQWDEYLRAHGG